MFFQSERKYLKNNSITEKIQNFEINYNGMKKNLDDQRSGKGHKTDTNRTYCTDNNLIKSSLKITLKLDKML